MAYSLGGLPCLLMLVFGMKTLLGATAAHNRYNALIHTVGANKLHHHMSGTSKMDIVNLLFYSWEHVFVSSFVNSQWVETSNA